MLFGLNKNYKLKSKLEWIIKSYSFTYILVVTKRFSIMRYCSLDTSFERINLFVIHDDLSQYFTRQNINNQCLKLDMSLLYVCPFNCGHLFSNEKCIQNNEAKINVCAFQTYFSFPFTLTHIWFLFLISILILILIIIIIDAFLCNK